MGGGRFVVDGVTVIDDVGPPLTEPQRQLLRLHYEEWCEKRAFGRPGISFHATPWSSQDMLDALICPEMS